MPGSADKDTGWTFHNPVRIHFGRGCRAGLPASVAGKRYLIVTTQRGRRRLTQDPLLEPLSRGAAGWVDSVSPNPGITELQEIIDGLRNHHFDVVIGFGGGSSMDSAKVLSIALSEGLKDVPLRDLIADASLHASARPLPLYAVPTTAGTGSEVTPYSTVWDHAQKKKFSLAGQAAYPFAAFVDPALTDGVPMEITLSTGLDAINQAAESIWNRNATPVTIGLATRALKLGFDALPRLVEEGDDPARRDAMAECSLLAGLAISQTRTALCHSMSYPITAHFGVPHGLACAFTMPAVLRLNVGENDGRFTHLSEALLGSGAEVEDLLTAFEDLHERLEVVERVDAYVGDMNRLLDLAPEMYSADRAGNNLAAVSDETIRGLIQASMDAI